MKQFLKERAEARKTLNKESSGQAKDRRDKKGAPPKQYEAVTTITANRTMTEEDDEEDANEEELFKQLTAMYQEGIFEGDDVEESEDDDRVIGMVRCLRFDDVRVRSISV